MEEEVGDSTEDTEVLSSETVGGHHSELLEDSVSAFLGSGWVSTLWDLMNLTEDLVSESFIIMLDLRNNVKYTLTEVDNGFGKSMVLFDSD